MNNAQKSVTMCLLEELQRKRKELLSQYLSLAEGNKDEQMALVEADITPGTKVKVAGREGIYMAVKWEWDGDRKVPMLVAVNVDIPTRIARCTYAGAEVLP